MAANGRVRALRRRQKVHASGARFRTRLTAGGSPAEVLLPSMVTDCSAIVGSVSVARE